MDSPACHCSSQSSASILGTDKHSYSQCGEDLIISYIFNSLGRSLDSYIDIGAHHPRKLNNTYLFYLNGARGINIEPDPSLMQAIEEYRPSDINLQIGIGPKTGELPFYVMDVPTLNTFSEAEARKYCEESGHRIVKKLQVRVFTVQDVLDTYHGGIFPDLLTLDAEGLDEIILDSIDFSRTKPTVICVETLEYTRGVRGAQKNSAIAAKLARHGYFTYADTYINTIFVLRDIWEKRHASVDPQRTGGTTKKEKTGRMNSTPKRLLDKAIHIMQLGGYGQALEILRVLEDQLPDSLLLMEHKAICQRHMGAKSEALQCLSGVFQADPSNQEVGLTLARWLKESGSTAVAAEVLESLSRVSQASAAQEHERGKTFRPCLCKGQNALEELRKLGLARPGQPLRLHLGCGQNHFDGYVNIDYPSERHVILDSVADVHADILQIRMPTESCDEIRLHHVFEHFDRATALALLIRWHKWLKPGGVLHLETPDFKGSAEIFLSNVPFRVRMAQIRGLAGDQAASWAYHVDHWFPERFDKTFRALGFEPISIASSRWFHEPWLANVSAIARKPRSLGDGELVGAAEELLADSLINPSEKPKLEVWKNGLRRVLAYLPVHEEVKESVSSVGDLLDARCGSGKSLDEIVDFNQRQRNRWVAEKASSVSAGSKVMDVGAGTCLYKPFFSHCSYVAQDFQQYEGVKSGGGTAYGQIDITSDITDIPVADGSFDLVLCTEVLEHVPEPVKALEELARILAPGGRLLLTAPLGSGLHQMPFHYYGGYTPEWYKLFLPRFGLQIVEMKPNGGFFSHLAQECARFAWAVRHDGKIASSIPRGVYTLFQEILPRYLASFDEDILLEEFSVGFFVEARKGC